MGPQLHQREDSLPSSFPSIKPYQRQHNMLRLAALFLLVSAWCLTSEAGVTAQCNREWQKNTDFNGDDLGKIKAEGPIQCEEACTKNPKCQFFTFVQKRKDCYPKASKSGQPGRVLKNPICISGFSLKGCVVPDCHFPFIYKGKPYDSCTTVDAGNTLWCSTTYKYQGQWRTCTDKDLNPLPPTTLAPVVPDCHFPFIYKGEQYDSCTTVDAGNTLWCSTTYKYQGQWRTCTDKDLRVKLKVW